MDRPRARVLLVEDERADAMVIRRGFERATLDYEIEHVEHADAVLKHLRAAVDRNEPPDLVLLDLELPDTPGIEILQRIRNGDVCPNVVVIVLTSASHRRLVTEVYEAGANAFVTKPSRLDALDDFIAHLEGFWLAHSMLPYQ